MNNQNKKTSRALKKGSISLIVSIVVIVLVILFNVLVGVLADRFPANIDLTIGKDYSMNLDEEYKTFLKNVEKDVNIIVCADQDDFTGATPNFAFNMVSVLSLTDNYLNNGAPTDATVKYARQTGMLFGDFTALNGRFKVTYKNPNSPTSFASVTAEYPDETFAYGDIIVEVKGNGNNRYQILKMTDYYERELNQQLYYYTYSEMYDLKGSSLASNLTSAIYVTTSDSSTKIAVYTGKGCKDLGRLKNLLQRNNYELIEVANFEAIDNDINSLLIYAPTTDLNKNDVDALDRYLKASTTKPRNLFYVANSSDQQFYSLPVMAEYLDEWNITMQPGYVCETGEYALANYPYYVQPIDQKSSYTADIDLSKLTFPYGIFNSFKIKTADTDTTYSSTPILKSSENAVILPANAEEGWKLETAPKNGPYDYVFKSTYTKTNGSEANVVVFAGDSFFGEEALENGLYSKQYLNSEYFANAKLTLNLFNGLTGSKETNAVEITTKTIVTTNFSDKISGTSWPTVILVVFVVLVPVALIVAGIVVNVRRKRR